MEEECAQKNKKLLISVVSWEYKYASLSGHGDLHRIDVVDKNATSGFVQKKLCYD
jgi:hypothetical protein